MIDVNAAGSFSILFLCQARAAYLVKILHTVETPPFLCEIASQGDAIFALSSPFQKETPAIFLWKMVMLCVVWWIGTKEQRVETLHFIAHNCQKG